LRTGVDDGGGGDAGSAEPGLRPKGRTVKHTRNFYKFTEWLGRAQDGDVSGDARLETRADETRACLGRGELVGISEIVEKCQMHRAGFVERSQPPDDLARPRGIDQMRVRQRGKISQR